MRRMRIEVEVDIEQGVFPNEVMAEIVSNLESVPWARNVKVKLIGQGKVVETVEWEQVVD